MERNRKKVSRPTVEETTVEPIFEMGDDAGLSLEDLAKTYASLMTGAADPYQAETEKLDDPAQGLTELPVQEALHAEDPPTVDDCEVSPRSILEALLFVGSPDNKPATARQIAALMRGVSPREIDELVAELNAEYESEGASFEIVSEHEGYRLQLREEFAPIREKFYGKLKEAKLSQGAIDVLAIVAYHQPTTAEAVEKLRGGQPSGSILGLLIRRDLVAVEKTNEKPRTLLYRTTDRFLDLFGLDSLKDLPQVQGTEPG